MQMGVGGGEIRKKIGGVMLALGRRGAGSGACRSSRTYIASRENTTEVLEKTEESRERSIGRKKPIETGRSLTENKIRGKKLEREVADKTHV